MRCGTSGRVLAGRDVPGLPESGDRLARLHVYLRVIGKLAQRYSNAAGVVTNGLSYFTVEDFATPADLYARGREAAATAYSVRDASAELELVRNLVELLLGIPGERSP